MENNMGNVHLSELQELKSGLPKSDKIFYCLLHRYLGDARLYKDLGKKLDIKHLMNLLKIARSKSPNSYTLD